MSQVPPFALSSARYRREGGTDNAKSGTGVADDGWRFSRGVVGVSVSFNAKSGSGAVEARARVPLVGGYYPVPSLSFSIIAGGMARRPIFSTRNELFMISFIDDIM